MPIYYYFLIYSMIIKNMFILQYNIRENNIFAILLNISLYKYTLHKTNVLIIPLIHLSIVDNKLISIEIEYR